MQIVVTIPDELAARAQARGLVLDRYLPELLAEDLAPEVSVGPDSGDEAAERRHAAVDRIHALRKGNLLGGLKIKDLVEEGRKY